MRARHLATALLLAGVPATLVAQHHAAAHGQPPARLGAVAFPNTAAPAAQPSFLRGLALLHSYEYTDARAAVRQARTIDRQFATAYWLEALAHIQFDWGIEDLVGARAVLARLGPTPDERLALARTADERALGRAVEAFLAPGTPFERAERFGAATRDWAATDTANVEAAAFAARAGLYRYYISPPQVREQRVDEAVALAERVARLAPEHPGAIHYLIHATDSPRHAARGLEAARIYDRIAPDAEHALHMPSHIYLQLGLWDEVVASNERSWAASREWVKRGNHGVAESGWHSLIWLQYGYLQQGRWERAAAVLDTARALIGSAAPRELEGFPDVRYAIETLAFQYGMETGRWDAYPRADTLVADRILSERTPRARSMAANAAYHLGLARLEGDGDTAGAAAVVRGLRAAAGRMPAGDRLAATLGRSAFLLEAQVAHRQGRHAVAAELAQRAIAGLQDSRLSPVGPPATVPFFEVMGAALAAAGRHAEAADAYARALEDRPERAAAWLGLARARAAAGDSSGAAGAYARLQAMWHAPDVTATAVREVRGMGR